MEHGLCELCRAQGLTSQLVLFQLNLDEAILLCKNKECVYPLGVAPNSNLFVRRKYSEISNTKRRRKKKEPKQLELQTWNNAPVIVQHLDSYLQWQNNAALCWLDSVLSSLVHNLTLQCFLQEKFQNKDCLLKDLLVSFSKAQEMCSVNREQAEKVLEDARQRVWTYLQPKMNCELGVNDSAITALLLLLKENSIISKETLQEYYWEFSCSACCYQQIDRRKKHLITFPNVTDDFSLQNAVFLRPCFNCGVPGQRSKLAYERMPKCIHLHFENGLKSNKILFSDINGANGRHRVTQLLQYKKNPDHFVSWVKEHKGDKWMEIDDLKSPLCRWETSFPSVPTSEIHIVVLEKVCTDPHHLAMVPATKNLRGLTANVGGTLAKEVFKDCSRSKDCSTQATNLDSKDMVNSRANQGNMGVSSTKSSVLSTFPQKTKAGPLVFEPYVPRKKRPVAHSWPNSPVEVNGFKCDTDRDTNVQFSSPLSPSFLSWQEFSEQSKAKANHSYLQSDSGYSSPASVSSCSSLPSTHSGVSHSTCDSCDDVHLEESVDIHCASDFLENDSNTLQLLSVTDRHEEKPSDLCPSDSLVDKLEELLPDCLLENATGLVEFTEDDMNLRLDDFQKLSAEQDQFILDLLGT